MTIYTGKNGLAAALRMKLMKVLYVPWIWHWCSILLSQADTSGVANLCHPKRTLPLGGELVQAFMEKYTLEHQIVHLELPTMHKPLMVAPCGTVHFRELLVIFFHQQGQHPKLELVLHGFVVCLNTGGDHCDI
jgi:hypothetical protein